MERPMSRSFASVDAVICGKHRIALQMSVSAEHGYKVEGLKNVRNSLNLNEKDPLDPISFGIDSRRSYERSVSDVCQSWSRGA